MSFGRKPKNEYINYNQNWNPENIDKNENIEGMPFIKVPNELIIYSLKNNRTILPLYLYTNTHLEVYNQNRCSFSLSFITSYYISLSKRSGFINKFKDGLQVLLQGDEENKLSNSFLLDENYEDNKEGEDKNGVITIKVVDKEVQIINGWTPIYYNEYFYIINSIKEKNKGVTGKKEWNLIDLLNLYCYYKSQIKILQVIGKSRDTNIKYKINLKKISELMGLGEKTIVKYSKELMEVGILNILSESEWDKRKKQEQLSSLSNQGKLVYSTMNIGNSNRLENNLNGVIKFGYNPKEDNIIELNNDWRNKNE